MLPWEQYLSLPNTVVGNLRVWRDVYSPQLANTRDIFVFLPPQYELTDERYPVIYMHDGQNLFDRHVAHSGEWEVDETMTALASEGLPAIVVGLPNMKAMRGVEYSPYPLTYEDGIAREGRADSYLRFIIDTVKPQIDAALRTLPQARFTGIAGSSMGGLVSLYGALTHADVFGLCGAFSPAYWFGDNGLLATTRARTPYPGRMYVDVGTAEGETLKYFLKLQGAAADAAYVQGVRDVYAALTEGGCGALLYVEAEGAVHREAAWARRFPAAMRFLLAEAQP